MPIRLSDYPEQWKAIAHEVKTRANWTCLDCQRPCKRPDETWDELKFRLARKSKKLYNDCCEKKGRFILTVAHLNHNTSDNSPKNLAAYCAPCHLRYDAKYHAQNATKTRAKKAAAKKPKPPSTVKVKKKRTVRKKRTV